MRLVPCKPCNLRQAALVYNAQAPAGKLAVAAITPLSTSEIYPCPIAGVAAPCQRHGAHGLLGQRQIVHGAWDLSPKSTMRASA